MPGAKILLVDDEPHIPLVVGRKLTGAGYQVLTAADGEEALAVATESLPDLVITDLQMPYMSGVELASALHDDERTRATPIILLTARGYVLPQEDRHAPNIRRYLAKPFSVQQILDAVRELVDHEAEAA